MLLLEQDTTKKGQVENNVTQLEFKAGDDAEYKVEAIWDSAVYARELEARHLPGLYYLILWKNYPEEENTWEPASAVQHLWKLVRTFHAGHPDKLTATSSPVDAALPIAKPIVKPTKQKRGQTAQATKITKRTKKNKVSASLYCLHPR